MEGKPESKVNILLVDDYPANLIALSSVLSDPIYHLIEATSGEEAIRITNETEIALILLDIQMPGMDGYEVAKQIRKNPRTKDIPIIFITAVYREEPAVRKGYEAGGQDYVGKPFDPEVLKAKVGIYSSLFIKNSILEKKARQLMESEERYRLIVEGVQEIIATFDAAGTITSLNLAFERLTGLKPKDWVGKSFVPLIDSNDLTDLLSAFGRAARQNSAQLSQTRIATSHKQLLPVEISVQPLTRDGKTLGIIGVIRDISARDEMLKKSG